MKRVIGMMGAATVHLAILVSFLPSCTPKHPQSGTESSMPKEVIVSISKMEKDPADEFLDLKPGFGRISRDRHPCPPKYKTFEGIGIIYSPFTYAVLSAPPDLPAYQAGVRVGDVMVDPYPGLHTGIHDGFGDFDFFRHAERFSIHTRTVIICEEAKQSPSSPATQAPTSHP